MNDNKIIKDLNDGATIIRFVSIIIAIIILVKGIILGLNTPDDTSEQLFNWIYISSVIYMSLVAIGGYIISLILYWMGAVLKNISKQEE